MSMCATLLCPRAASHPQLWALVFTVNNDVQRLALDGSGRLEDPLAPDRSAVLGPAGAPQCPH